MRLTIGILLLLTMILGNRSAAQNSNYVTYSTDTKVMLKNSGYATNGHDWEQKLDPMWLPMMHVAIYKTAGIDGWDGDTGFYVEDARPAINPGQRAVFDNIYVWADTGMASRPMYLTQSGPAYPGMIYKLFLVSVPEGITYTGPREWGRDHGTITLPFFATDDGRDGYKFRLEISSVPEPSSLLALAGGLAGVGGFALRRRR